MAIKILIAGDDPGFRELVRRFLDRWLDVTVVVEVENGDEAVRLARQLQPDVAFVDIAAGRVDGREAPSGKDQG